MIITTVYEAESKAEEKCLRIMAATMQNAGMEVDLKEDVAIPGDENPLRLSVKESRRARKGKVTS